MKIYKYLILLLLLTFFPAKDALFAQITEPEVQQIPRNFSTLDENYSSGFGFNVLMNNFGFGAGMEFRRVIAPQSELTASLRLTALRDPSEQTFTDVFFGQQIVPNKYQRAFAFPFMLGLRQRVFADTIGDDYRFFVSASMGPAAAFTYPYFDDPNNMGYRFTGNELVLIDDELFRFQPMQVNDIFSGWSDGEWHWGGAGEFKVGVDIGSNFARLSSIEFGYFFYYFPESIQIMMPNQPVFRRDVFQTNVVLIDDNGDPVLEPFYEPQRFFGSPQITFTFGWLR